MSRPLLSKSRFMTGVRCDRLAWAYSNTPEAIPPPDSALQVVFDIGNEVGNLAKECFPDGVDVPMNRDFGQMVAETVRLLPDRRPIFEASFSADGCYCRVDILVPAAAGNWDLFEVKASASVKPEHLLDVAFQANVLEASGLTLGKLFLMHVNTSYVRRGAIDPAAFFQMEDVTDAARAQQSAVADKAQEMLRVIAGSDPDVPVGPHCRKGEVCPLWGRCVPSLPEHNVFTMYRGGKKAFSLLSRGVSALADVADSALSANQKIQRDVVRSGHAHVNIPRIRSWLRRLKYPLYLLDFETINPAIPLYDGTRPYEKIPFQMSLHVVEREGAPARHVEFLADSPDDPRPALVRALRAIGPQGHVVAYNATFEREVITGLAGTYPQERTFLEGLRNRIVDLGDPFRRFWYYHSEQRGRWSLKQVLPAVTGAGYQGLDIADGGAAMVEFERVVFGSVPAKEKQRVLDALRIYCRRDTEALVELLDALRALV